MKRAVLTCLVLAAACAGPEGGSDAAMSMGDAAVHDAGTPTDAAAIDDGGAAPSDAAADAGAATDASSADAGAAADSGRPSTGSCDARRVLCERLPPTCDTGEAPSVDGVCWGPCIPATSCTCASAEECPDVPGFSETCHTGRGLCGPFL